MDDLYLFLHPQQYEALCRAGGKRIMADWIRIVQAVGKKPLTLEEYLDANAQGRP